MAAFAPWRIWKRAHSDDRVRRPEEGRRVTYHCSGHFLADARTASGAEEDLAFEQIVLEDGI